MSDLLVTSSGRRRLVRGPIVAFIAISLATAVLVIVAFRIQGVPAGALVNPVDWLRTLDRELAFEIVSGGAQLLAAILAIAITVVAIVVELAANRYSHRITSLFVREPVNIIVMSFFVVATVQSLWIALSLGEDVAIETMPNAGLLISMALVTLALLTLLPYFAFVLSFLSPVNVIQLIRYEAVGKLKFDSPESIERSKQRLQDGIDDLQDIARRASQLSDRAVAMFSINALTDILRHYQSTMATLPEAWFEISESVSNDPDFVSINANTIREIEKEGTWVEVKIMRQYLDLISDSNPSSRDTTYLIAINTRRIGIAAIEDRPALVELCIHCFNSYLRATINNDDQRTSYYIMNQYRAMAEELLKHRKDEAVRAIALHFQFYGILGFKARIPFLLEVAAYDLMLLIERCVEYDSKLVDGLLTLLLELDQEIREEFQEDSLLGVRRTQIQLATFFLARGDEDRAMRIARDLKDEKPARLEYLRQLLIWEQRPQYWEFTDRGVNFSYLTPALREHLGTVFLWISAA